MKMKLLHMEYYLDILFNFFDILFYLLFNLELF